MAFSEVSRTGKIRGFAGFENFVNVINNSEFSRVLSNTVVWTILVVVLSTLLGFILALLLNRPLKGRAFFRALYFFPVIIISGPVMSKLMSNQAFAIISPDQFTVYQVLQNLPDLISVPLCYIFDNIVVILWYSGVQTLIILADCGEENTTIEIPAGVNLTIQGGDYLARLGATVKFALNPEKIHVFDKETELVITN